MSKLKKITILTELEVKEILVHAFLLEFQVEDFI